ncbi:MAG: hypothetical protein ACOH5I_18760 [Oligoflexus sp.]
MMGLFIRLGILASLLSTASLQATVNGDYPKKFNALIGNHDFITVIYDDASHENFQVQYFPMNGNNESYKLSLASQIFAVELPAGALGFSTSESDDEEMRKYLKRMRDLISYAAGPERYEWQVFGRHILSPELNDAIIFIDQVLADRPEDNSNCQVYATSLTQEPWSMSGGVFGDLGNFDEIIDFVWVRAGYELVLVSGRNLPASEVEVVRARGNQNVDTKELASVDTALLEKSIAHVNDGRAYTLSGSLLDGSVRSLICRPYLR